MKAQILELLRDKGNLFFIAFFPSVLVFLLGNLLTNLDFADDKIQPINLQYSVETRDNADRSVVEAFLAELGQNSAINLSRSEDFTKTEAMVNSGALSAAVLFSEPLEINIYHGHDSVQNRAVDTIFAAFSRQLGAFRTVGSYLSGAAAEGANPNMPELVEDKDLGYNRTMLDYYAVAMIVMILFMGGSMSGAGVIQEGQLDGTLSRCLASPKSRVSIYVQTVLACIPQNILQVGIVMLTSVLIFGAHYANTFPLNLLLFFTLFIAGVAVNSLFSIVGIFIKANPALVLMPVIWIIMFISGTFSKEIYIQGVTEYSPIWYIQNAAFDLTVFGRTGKCLTVLAASSAVLLITIVTGSLLFRRKEASL
jgi:ABC-2 type transport system permease protein